MLVVLEDEASADTPQTNYKYPRASATLAVGHVRPDKVGVPALAGIVEKQGGWEYQRAAACFTLGRIGPGASEAFPVLKLASQDASPIVRAHAARGHPGDRPGDERRVRSGGLNAGG